VEPVTEDRERAVAVVAHPEDRDDGAAGPPRRRSTIAGAGSLGTVAVLLAAVTVATPGAATPAGASGRRSAVTAGVYRAFTDPQPVTIEGYSGSAMEPFITDDGQDLLFNTSNQSPSIPAIQYASRVGPGTFSYQGAVAGANDPDFLSGTPSLDTAGNLYFVSTRSYAQTLSTVYTGVYASGAVTGVHLVAGVSAPAPGTVDFDVDVSPDGATLYVSVGLFDGGSAPEQAHLALFDKQGNGFVPDPAGTRVLRAVNSKKALDYAAAISADGLELFFTRAVPGAVPAVYRAVRTSATRPFGHVQRVAAITGFAEAPSLSADGSTLYYHLLVGDQFDIETVTRPPPPPNAHQP
jgi:hypothetical protein